MTILLVDRIKLARRRLARLQRTGARAATIAEAQDLVLRLGQIADAGSSWGDE